LIVKDRPMLRSFGIVAVAAILLASFTIAPPPADGFGGPRGLNRGSGFRGFNPGGFQGFDPGGFQGFNPGGFSGLNPGHAGRPFKQGVSKDGRFLPHQGFHRSFPWGSGYFIGGGGYLIGGYGAPLYYDSTDYGSMSGGPLLYDSPVYNPPPVYTTPVYVPVVVPLAGPGPAAPARSSVIEYPEGRYELRGDGVSILYNWVWIPNPPAGPPASAPPLAAPSSGDRSGARRAQLYRWVDEQGVLHMTDNAEAVPEQFRKETKRNNPL
jgi:hypothetical protein